MAPASDPARTLVLAQAELGHGRTTVVHGATATAPAGARVLLVGDNGSGKSTLIATLAGLLPVRGGRVEVAGSDPFKARRTLHTRIGHMPHTDPFYPELTGHENLRFHARLHGRSEDAVTQGLESVGLARHAHRLVGTYSHGMRRRLGLARVLVHEPGVLLLDEPESGLDAHARADMRARLGALGNVTMVLATHDPAAWLDWADHAWVIARGRLRARTRDDDTPLTMDDLARTGLVTEETA